MLGFTRQRTVGAVVGKTLAAALATGSVTLPTPASAVCADGTNRCYSDNSLYEGTRRGRALQEQRDTVGWGGPRQGRGNPHAQGRKDSYDYVPTLATGATATYIDERGCRVTIRGGDRTRGIGRQLVSKLCR